MRGWETTMACLAGAWLGAAGLGCASQGVAPIPSDAHVGPDTDEPRELARSATFLVTHLELQRGPDQGGRVVGLDLDGQISSGDPAARDCRDRHADRTSPTGLEGVDNQMVVGLVPLFLELDPSLELDLDAPIQSGTRLHAVRVTELDDTTNDPSVRVEVMLVERAGCDASPCPLGEVQVGDAFVDRGMSIASDLAGSIEEGRLRFAMPRYAFLEGAIWFDLSDVVVEVTMDDEGLEGAMAGAQMIERIFEIADAIMTSIKPPDHTMQRMMLRQHSDLSPSADDPSVCDAISFGLSLEATRVFVAQRR